MLGTACLNLADQADFIHELWISTKIKVMNIERMEFIAWMERIMNRFDILSESIKEAKKDKTAIDGEELLDNQDVLEILKISNRSLQRYRSEKKLPYYTISGKLYYKLSDVHEFIRECFNAPIKRTKTPSKDK